MNAHFRHGVLTCIFRPEIRLDGTMKILSHIRTKAKITPSFCLSWILFNLSVTALYFILSSTNAYAGHITLGWDKSTESDVIGCKIYYGTATRNYTQNIKIASPNITTCTILNLSDGQRYYFAATAYNTELIESDYSAEVFATINPVTTSVPTTTTTMQPTTSSSTSSVIQTTSVPTTTTTTTTCTYSVSPTSSSFNYFGGTGSVNVSTQSVCTWSATSTASWIKITSKSSGNGATTVAYSVDSNRSNGSRKGTMKIAGKTFTIQQTGLRK
jgi:hypothetical protein